MNRRSAGWLSRMLPVLGLEKTKDGRRRQGQRWQLGTVLRSALVGLMSGMKSLKNVEWLTADMSKAMRKLLGIPRRLSDSTLRGVLVKLSPDEIRARLNALIRYAHRIKALAPIGLPFGVVAMDGKATALPVWDDRYASRTLHEKTAVAYGLVRTVTCVLVSALGMPCLDAIPLLDGENEVGAFQAYFESMLGHFGHLFRLVTYDAGGTSEENAKAVVEAGKDYLFRLKNELNFMTKAAMGWLSGLIAEQALAQSEDVLSKEGEAYVIRRVYLCQARSWGVFSIWSHVKTFVRIQSQKVVRGQVISEENRYYGSSLALDVLTPAQWLTVVRNHWGVELTHNVFDSIFKEDDKPWIRTSPRGMLVTLLLRRIAYTLMTLFKSRAFRGDDGIELPWDRLMTWLYNALISATAEDTLGLRDRMAIAATS